MCGSELQVAGRRYRVIANIDVKGLNLAAIKLTGVQLTKLF
jgi:hypothetical protein